MNYRVRLSICVVSLLVSTACGLGLGPALAPDAEAPDDRYRIELRELAPGVWLHTSWYTYPSGTRYPSNGLALEEDGALLLIDTAWGELQTIALLEELREVTGLEVGRAVITHFHNDRAAGTDVLEHRGVEVFAHPRTQRLAIGAGTPVPDRVLDMLEEPGSLTAFGSVEIAYPGEGHTIDNIVVWHPESRVLFGGCAVRELGTARPGNLADANLEEWPESIRRVATRFPDARIVVPGHGEPGDAELLRHTITLLERSSEQAD